MRVQFCNVRRCDTKAFMKAICDDKNISLDGQFGALLYLLEKWSASLKSTCVASWRQGLHSGIDPTVRTQSFQLLGVIRAQKTKPILTFLCVSLVQSKEMPPDSMSAHVKSLHEFPTLHDAVLGSCACQRVARGEDESKTRRLIPKRMNS